MKSVIVFGVLLTLCEASTYRSNEQLIVWFEPRFISLLIVLIGVGSVWDL